MANTLWMHWLKTAPAQMKHQQPPTTDHALIAYWKKLFIVAHSYFFLRENSELDAQGTSSLERQFTYKNFSNEPERQQRLAITSVLICVLRGSQTFLPASRILCFRKSLQLRWRFDRHCCNSWSNRAYQFGQNLA